MFTSNIASLAGRLAFCGFILITTVHISSAQTNAGFTFYGVAFPETIAGYKRQTNRDFESTNPGLGYGVTYYGPAATLSIYIYDSKQASIPKGAPSPAIARELANAKEDIYVTRRSGTYSIANWKTDFLAPETPAGLKFQCAEFELEHAQAKGLRDSFVCITGWNNKFFKIRLTLTQSTGSKREAERVIDTWASYLVNSR